MSAAYLVVAATTVVAATLASGYFRRFQPMRPPIGVMNLRDVVIMLGAIVALPYVYLTLPLWVVAVLFSGAILGALYFVWEPVLESRARIWTACLLLLGADLVLALTRGTTDGGFLLVNNLLLVTVVVGVTNLWAQSGMKARDVAVLAVGLAVFDVIATSRLTVMTDLVTRLSGMPLLPVVTWRASGGARGLAIGLGDLLLASLFPLVLRKSFGRRAGSVALVVSVCVIATMLAVIDLRLVRTPIPAMVVLGPLMALQYGYWRARRGSERTTLEYLRAEPLPSGTSSEVAPV